MTINSAEWELREERKRYRVHVRSDVKKKSKKKNYLIFCDVTWHNIASHVIYLCWMRESSIIFSCFCCCCHIVIMNCRHFDCLLAAFVPLVLSPTANCHVSILGSCNIYENCKCCGVWHHQKSIWINSRTVSLTWIDFKQVPMAHSAAFQ